MTPSLKHALLVALYGFIGTFGASLLGFLNDVQSAMATGGHIPSVAILAKAFMSAVVAVIVGLVAWAINWAGEKSSTVAKISTTETNP